jgi:hypothetical protein
MYYCHILVAQSYAVVRQADSQFVPTEKSPVPFVQGFCMPMLFPQPPTRQSFADALPSVAASLDARPFCH